MQTITQFISNTNIKTKNDKRKNLNYIAFIKFIAMIKIIKWHLYKWKKNEINYGSRMCEILFVSSGFLVGYNYYQKNMQSDYETSFKYTYKHLRNFYPLECFNIIYGFFRKPHKKYDLTELEILISNFLIIKSWSYDMKLAQYFTGLSWFLSNLLFCYFFVPLLLKGIKNNKNSLIFFLLISLIRISIEIALYNGAKNMFHVDLHRGLFIRLFEFYMGMLLAPTYFLIKNRLDRNKNDYWFKIIFTIIHVVFPVIFYYILLIFDNKWHCCYFVLVFCFFIIIVGHDYGYLSHIFANKLFTKVWSCQMEMFLLQKTINNIILSFKKRLNYQVVTNPELEFLIKLLIIFFVAYLYKMFFKEKLALFLDKLISYFIRLFS